MPSASTAKLEKQASSEAIDPIKQSIVFVDHKIRNLMKKKGRLDAYKDEQKNGKDLDADQKQALKKYDEVCQNLLFAQDLKKQLNLIQEDTVKLLKKKEKKEAYEREQQEVGKVKEILIIQDVLAGMGGETVRDDFLAGKNRAVQLTEVELQYLDDLFVEVSPKRDLEEGQPPFLEQAQNAAKHLLCIVEGKDKEIVGTKYSILRDLIHKIHNCGYFDPNVVQETAPESLEPHVEQAEVLPAETVVPVVAHPEPAIVPSATFHPGQPPVLEQVQPPVVETAGLYISQRPMAEVLNNVMGTGPTPFNFIQESELESPEVVAAPLPTPVPTALPIPTQTFTNTNFAAPPHVYQTIQDGSIAVVYPPTPAPQYIQTPPAHIPAPTLAPVPEPQRQYEPEPAPSQQQTGVSGAEGDWNSENTAEQNDWAVAVEQSEQNRWNEPPAQTDEWTDNSNDGFQPARGGGSRGRGRGGERGDRGGRGGPRGNRGNHQNGRGGGYYNRNEGEGGRSNYYQNGYGSRGGDRNEGGYNRERGEGGYNRERGEGGYNRERGEGGYNRDRGDGGYRGDREGGYRGDREGGYRGDREGGYRGDREGGYRGERRGGPRGGGQDRSGPRPDRGGPRGGGGRGGPRGNRGSDRGGDRGRQ